MNQVLAYLPFMRVLLFFLWCATGFAQQTGTHLLFPVYLEKDRDEEPTHFEGFAGGAGLRFVNSLRFEPSRPILLVFDSSSYSVDEIRPLVSSIAAALSAELSKRPALRVHVGIPGPNGAFFSLPVRGGAMSGDVISSILHAMTSPGDERPDPGQFLEWCGRLLQRGESESGALDCIVIARDREFAGDSAGYLTLRTEHRITDLCFRKGSMIHGLLDGYGTIRSLCKATGGLVFDRQEGAASAFRAILEARERSLAVEFEDDRSKPPYGRLELSIRARGSSGKEIPLREPLSIWRNRPDTPVPDHSLVLDSLDWVRRAKKSAEGKDLNAALLWMDNALQLDPYNSGAFSQAGEYALQAGDPVRAEQYASRAMELSPITESTILVYGAACQRLHRPEEALRKIPSPANGDSSTDVKKMRARLLASAGREAEAAGLFKSLLGLAPEDNQLRADYGCLLQRMGDKPGSEELLHKALETDPRSVTALVCMADAAGAAGRRRESLRLLEQALSMNPENAETLALSGKILAREKEWERALQSYQEAAKREPFRTDFLPSLAEAELQSGNFAGAAETMRRALNSNPSDPAIWREIGGIYERAGLGSDAAAVLEQAAARNRTAAIPFYLKAAQLREIQGEFGQSLLDYQAAIESAPAEEAQLLKQTYGSHLAYLTLLRRGIETRLRGKGSNGKPGANGIVIPGGLTPLSNLLGIESAALQTKDAAGRVFSTILETTTVSRQDRNQIKFDLASYFVVYEQLIRHLRKNGLIPANYVRDSRLEISLPLKGDKAETEKSRKFLKFFGVKYAPPKRGGAPATIILSPRSQFLRRQELLQLFGVDLRDRRVQNLKITVGDEILPAIFDAKVLAGKILGENHPPERLLAAFVRKSEAMRLYSALESCSDSLRRMLVANFTAGELSGIAGLLSSLGRFLDVSGGSLRLPGTIAAWEELAGVSSSNPGDYLRAFLAAGKGRLVVAYVVLSNASPSVQAYFTASAARLKELLMLIAPRLQGSNEAIDLNAARIVRLLSADTGGLFLPLDGHFAPYLTAGRAKAAPSDPGRLRISVDDLTAMLGKANLRSPVEVASILEMLVYLQAQRPALLARDVMDALVRGGLAETAVCLDLVWNLDPPPDLLVRYLDYCREVAAAGGTGWNISRTRTSQSLIYLTSLMRMRGTLDRDTAIRFLREELSAFAAKDEWAFLTQVGKLLRDSVLPELTGILDPDPDPSTLMLRALAGQEHPEPFLFEGTPLVYSSANELERMKAAIRLQKIVPLGGLLSALQAIDRIVENPSPEWTSRLIEILSKFPDPQLAPSPAVKTPGFPGIYQAAAAQLKNAAAGAPFSSVLKTLVPALHNDLGVSLLAHCYVYHTTPQMAALVYDNGFVRKHEFYQPGQRPGWQPAEVQTGDDRGSLIRGSLSGLGFQLYSMEMQAAAKRFRLADWSRLVPAMMSGMLDIPHRLLSRRAREFTALTMNLGREVLALGVTARERAEWSDRAIASIVPPTRREELQDHLRGGRVVEAAALLSPSEMFLLGEKYLIASGVLPGSTCGRLFGLSARKECVTDEAKPPEIHSPLIARLREIIPASPAPDQAAFLDEIDQYGGSLWHRIGLTERSPLFLEPYEQVRKYTPPELLFDRMIDLKIRVAEIGYSAGLPASLSGILGSMAVQTIVLDPAASSVYDWPDILDLISRLNEGNVRSWIQEMLGAGRIALRSSRPFDGQKEAR